MCVRDAFRLDQITSRSIVKRNQPQKIGVILYSNVTRCGVMCDGWDLKLSELNAYKICVCVDSIYLRGNSIIPWLWLNLWFANELLFMIHYAFMNSNRVNKCVCWCKMSCFGKGLFLSLFFLLQQARSKCAQIQFKHLFGSFDSFADCMRKNRAVYARRVCGLCWLANIKKTYV